jgi:hypothetical protein
MAHTKTAAMKIVREVVANERQGWKIIEDTLRVRDGGARIKLSLGTLEKWVGISLTQKKITWSEG